MIIIAVVSAILILITLIVLYSRNEELKRNFEILESENREMKNTIRELEMEQLKFQLQPHTLNNILANLRSISLRLTKGMDALSNTLDYILYKGKNHLVSVEDELTFLKEYISLNDIFLTEIDAVKIESQEVDKVLPCYTNPCIPHLITAYAIENAFKHGDVHHPEFLRVIVRLHKEGFELEVINRIKPNYQEKEAGIGLINMKKRLSNLYNDAFDLSFSCNEEVYKFKLKIRL